MLCSPQRIARGFFTENCVFQMTLYNTSGYYYDDVPRGRYVFEYDGRMCVPSHSSSRGPLIHSDTESSLPSLAVLLRSDHTLSQQLRELCQLSPQRAMMVTPP